MGWDQHAVLWQVYPLGFTGAPIREVPAPRAPVHRLGQVTAWLDYALQLGCNGLLLGPIFASQTHGYDTTDYLRIDPRLGDQGDFDTLIDAAHARGISVVLDGVFNHVGRSYPLFRDFEGGDARARAFFATGPDGAPVAFEGHTALVTLNHANPDVADLVASVMNHWLDRGADGWRLDAAYRVPASFWTQVLPQVRARHPHAWILGEMIHGDYAAYCREAGLDSVTQYELWKAIWSSLDTANFFELAWALQRHSAYCQEFMPNTFVGNHDVTRIASQISDARHLGHAVALLALLPGVPSIYAGDEQGLRAVKEEREGGDDAIRPTFPATPGPSPHQLPGGDLRVLRDHQRLIGLRRRHPWLWRARLEVALLSNRAIALTFAPRGTDAPAIPDAVGPVPDPHWELALVLNLGDTGLDVTRPDLWGHHEGPGLGAGSFEVALAPENRNTPTTTQVPAHSWVVYARG